MGTSRAGIRQLQLRVFLPLAWVVLVTLFFSFSTGKRGVYILPALPGLVIAAAPWLSTIAQRRGAQRTLFALACTIAVITLAGAVFWSMHP